MNLRSAFSTLLSLVVVSSSVFQGASLPAERRLQDRIAHKIERTSTVVVAGNVHPMANSRHDLGRMPASFRMQHVTMLFKPTDTQQAELDALLEQQQDPKSPKYHHWLSPEEFAGQFGLSENDINKVEAWLQGQGFTIEE